MKQILISSLLFISITAAGQTIKEMKIAELESYIQSRSQPSIINFWATWCAPCLEEMPWFNKTVKQAKHKNIELIFVSLDNQKAYPEKIKEIINKKNIEATFIWLNETNADEFCPKIDPEWNGTIPATLFVNHQKGRRKFLEAQISTTQLKKQISSLTR